MYKTIKMFKTFERFFKALYLYERWGVIWDPYLVQGDVSSVSEVFILLTGHASSHILFYPPSCAWLVESL
jgi:hypothetical protein